MKKTNFRILVVCVLTIAIACSIGASGVSALTPEGSGLLDDLTSAAGGIGSIIGGFIPTTTTKEATTKAPVNMEEAEEELGNILGNLGIGSDILKITDLVAYINKGGSFAEWIYDNYGSSVEIPESVKNMNTAELVMFLMTSVLYPDATTASKEPTTPDYVFNPGGSSVTTTKKQNNTTTVPEVTIKPSYKTGDVDGDGKVTAKDARLALRASAQIEKLYATPFDAADVNGDGRVTAGDARSILRYSAKLANGF